MALHDGSHAIEWTGTEWATELAEALRAILTSARRGRIVGEIQAFGHARTLLGRYDSDIARRSPRSPSSN